MLPGVYHEVGKSFIVFNRRCGYFVFGESLVYPRRRLGRILCWF